MMSPTHLFKFFLVSILGRILIVLGLKDSGGGATFETIHASALSLQSLVKKTESGANCEKTEI
jgi:hypothetical protein